MHMYTGRKSKEFSKRIKRKLGPAVAERRKEGFRVRLSFVKFVPNLKENFVFY